MQAVYILGDGSKAENEEIRYSIRSLEANMLDLEHVFVVGECPDFLGGVTHIEAEDKYEKKWQNAHHKTLVACEHEEIDEQFLLMNDDFFLCEPFMGAEFPFYSKPDTSGGVDGPKSFALHCPIRIVKDFYKQIPLNIDAGGDHSPRTFYANFAKAPPTPMEDCIVREGEGIPDFDEQIAGRQWFTIGDTIMTSEKFRYWLHERWPDATEYEQKKLLSE